MLVLIHAVAFILCGGLISSLKAQQCDAYYEKVVEQFEAFRHQAETLEREWITEKAYLNSPHFYPPVTSVLLPISAAMRAQMEGDETLEREAVDMLLHLNELKQLHPDSLLQQVPEYQGATPLLHNFFCFFTVTRAYLYVRESQYLSDAQRTTLDSVVGLTADYMCRFPEWGAMNRSIIRGLGLLYAAEAMPKHPQADQWRSVAHTLYAESRGTWQIEDAQLYQSLWMYCMILFAEQIGDDSLAANVQFRFYFDYYLNLMSPTGMVPAFGDARFEESRFYLVPVFEWAAREYQRADYAWVARRIWQRSRERHPEQLQGFIAMTLLDAWRWCPQELVAEQPELSSGPALDDVISKKIVFRSGLESDDTFMLLNYREQSDFGGLASEFINQTIPVEAEKTHHGHDDINAIVNLTAGGQLLLASAGYRDGVPNGPYGGFRADYFQNRLVVRNRRRWPGQGLFEFLRDAGTYQPVSSRLIDFTSFRDLDVSRTRLQDDRRGYREDRVITWLREPNIFVVVDIVEVLRDGHYSFANLWHGTDVHQRGDHYFVSSVDSVSLNATNDSEAALLIYFPETVNKRDSLFPLTRNGTDSYCMYQSTEGHYLQGSFETFVTILAPQTRAADPSAILESVDLLDVDSQQGVGISVRHNGVEELVAVKSNLRADLNNQNHRPRYTFDRGKVRYGKLKTDAVFAHVQLDSEMVRSAATHLTQLDFAEQTLFQSAMATFTLQPHDNSTGYGRPKWRRWESDASNHNFVWPRSGDRPFQLTGKTVPR